MEATTGGALEAWKSTEEALAEGLEALGVDAAAQAEEIGESLAAREAVNKQLDDVAAMAEAIGAATAKEYGTDAAKGGKKTAAAAVGVGKVASSASAAAPASSSSMIKAQSPLDDLFDILFKAPKGPEKK